MVSLSFLLPLALACLLVDAAGDRLLGPDPDTPNQNRIWGPTAIYYWRCSSRIAVEVSYDREEWFPSSICHPGYCCSQHADGPLCTQKACAMEDGRGIDSRLP